MRLHKEKPKSKRYIEQEIAATALQYEQSQSKKIGKWVIPQRWDRSAKRNTLCEICLHPVSCCSSMDALCSLCNVVAHVSCLTTEQRKQTFRNSWICDDCVSDVNDSKEQFVMNRTKQNYEAAATAAQVAIAKSYRRYRHIKLYRTALISLVRLQGICGNYMLTNFLIFLCRVRPVHASKKFTDGVSSKFNASNEC